MRFRKLDILPVILIYVNIITIFKFIASCYVITGVDYIYITILYIASIGVIFFFHYVLYKFTYKILGIVSIAGVWVIWFLLNMQGFSNIIYSNYQFNSTALVDAINEGKVTYFAQYKPFLLIILPILLLILMFFSFRGHDNLILIIELAMLIVFWYVNFSEIVKSYLFRFTFVMLLTYAVNIYRKQLIKYEKKGIKIQVSLVPVVALGILAGVFISYSTSILPQSYKGKYDTTMFNSFQNEFANTTEKKIDRPDMLYDLNSSGYDENSSKRLGGPITTLNDNIVMRVKATTPTYLRGIVKDYYDGFSWSTENYKYDSLDTDTSTNDVLDKCQKYVSSLNKYATVNTNQITVFPLSIKASTYFAPLNTYKIFDGENITSKNEANTFIKGKGREVSGSYDIFYYSSYTVPDDFNMLCNINKDAEIFKYTNSDTNNISKKYKKYLEVPNTITPRTKMLVNDVINGCSTNDQKVNKIYNYLKTNYPYSLSVSEVPKGHEFLDYFLFEEKKGYCTYFATAATMMCRIAGIPARYVEGFHMTDQKDKDGSYILTNKMAHAWCEVLASPESDTWVTLDCTGDSYARINESQARTNANPGNTAFNEDPSKKHSKSTTGKSLSTVNTGTKAISKKQGQSISKLNIILLITALIILVRILLINIKKRKMIKNNSVIPLYKYTLKRLKTISIAKPNAKTEMEFISDLYNLELKKNMNEIVPLVYKEYYSRNKDKGNKEFDSKKFYKFIEQHVRERQNVMKYILVKFFTI